MRFVKNYLKENLKWLLLVLACFGILCFVIGFEQVPLAQWGYAAFLCFFLFLLVVIIDFTRRYLHHKKLEKQTSEIAVTMDKLSLPRGQMETDYQELLRSLYITGQPRVCLKITFGKVWRTACRKQFSYTSLAGRDCYL